MAEVQDIFQEYGEKYIAEHKMYPHLQRTMKAIKECRTSALGAHEDVCDECGYKKISYNSCRNRNCPKCQSSAKEKWIYDRKSEVLNIQYFHVVFTIPSELNVLTFQNQTKMYNVLFKSVSETLKELGLDDKYLGAELGLIAILHTWGQNLCYHPHIHCIVPAGGLTKIGKWRNSKKKFFIPVKVLSRKFRGKFLYYLKREKLDFYGKNKYLEEEANYNDLLNLLYKKEWITYCKKPFKDANRVIEYLGRYTHRVAISNERILKVENGTVTFKWKDYKDNSKWKNMTVTASEFIRRFLLHVLPPQFMKIRHYGILGNRNKTKKLAVCKKLTNTTNITKEKLSTFEILKKTLGENFNKCPKCQNGHLIRVAPT